MGLLDSLVNVPERLRVWQLAGVRYFYVDPELAAASAVAEAWPEPAPVASAPPPVWPEAWQAVLAKAPPHPRLVITYDALGLDLSGRSDPRRGGLWRALLRDLGLAGRNLVAFWPFSLPEGEALTPRLDIFRDGLDTLAPQAVAFFGAPPPGLPGGRDASGHSLLFDRYSVAILPDPEMLLQDDPEVWAHVVATLAAMVR